MRYVYAEEDPRPVQGRYFYTPFGGRAFLEAYRAARTRAIERLLAAEDAEAPALTEPGGAPATLPAPGQGPVATGTVVRALAEGTVTRATAEAWRDVLVRKLEVARRLRAAYTAELRPASDDEASPQAYAWLAAFLAREAALGADAPDAGLLSTLLKAGDIVTHLATAAPGSLRGQVAGVAADALEAELRMVAQLASRPLPVPSGPPVGPTWAAPPASAGSAAAERRRVVMLAADTARARAYLDLLSAAGCAPDSVVLVALEGAALPGAGRVPTPLFDNITPLADALRGRRIPATALDVPRLDAPEVVAALAAVAPATVVIAPPAGILLAPSFFRVEGLRYLHVHPGRLPGHRGSTPMYYQLLEEGRLTATALLLDAGIDTGQVVAEREFDPPADPVALDHAFDPWMRAALLRDVLVAEAGGRAIVGRPQDGPARTWYVIHPVLRHVALLNAGAADPAPVPS